MLKQGQRVIDQTTLRASVYKHIDTYLHLCICMPYIYTHMIYVRVYIHVCVYLYICICIGICICMHMRVFVTGFP